MALSSSDWWFGASDIPYSWEQESQPDLHILQRGWNHQPVFQFQVFTAQNCQEVKPAEFILRGMWVNEDIAWDDVL